ncbi:hypothetical protein [Litchfieldia alkalitelluris]|uniref:hypothetical protein n=1 Tax=Litchfieldia alkalitelluris TaxID=304268 RepID=UPI000996660A|nr:hypothetical protein [Litchfieldia alkalitelluris]
MEGFVPVFFVIIIIIAIFSLTQALSIKTKSWKIGTFVDEDEARQYVEMVNKLIYVPNKPTYWNSMKDSYWKIIRSDEVSYQTKYALYDAMSKHNVRGIKPPRKQERPSQPTYYRHENRGQGQTAKPRNDSNLEKKQQPNPKYQEYRTQSTAENKQHQEYKQKKKYVEYRQ